VPSSIRDKFVRLLKDDVSLIEFPQPAFGKVVLPIEPEAQIPPKG
jgi:hypothetical protein